MGAGWGIGQGTFGVFVNPITEEMGWSRAAISFMYSISMMVSFSFGAFWGWLSDRWSAKGVVIIAGGLAGLGIFLSSMAETLWQFYLLYGLVAGAGLGGTTGALTGLATRWFRRRRGLAIGIGFAGSAAGGASIPILAEHLIADADWRFAFQVLAFVIWGAFLIGTLLIKEPRRRTQPAASATDEEPADGQPPDEARQAPPESGPAIPLSGAVRMRQFWVLFGMITAPELLFTMLVVHLVPAAIDSGITSATAATLLTVLGGAKIVGMMGGGTLGDRIGHRKVYVGAMIVQGLTLLWLTAGVQIWMFYVFAVAYGLSNGSWSPQFPAIAAQVFGIRHIGAIIGAVLLGAGVGGLIGPVMAGYIFDTSGSYNLAFYLATGVAGLGAGVALLMRPGGAPPPDVTKAPSAQSVAESTDGA